MVTGITRRLRVPRFASLNDFMLAKKWYMRALYMPGPERHDLEARLRRHGIDHEIESFARGSWFQPDLSPFQVRFKHTHKIHIHDTSAPG